MGAGTPLRGWPVGLKGPAEAVKHAFLSPSGAPAWVLCHAKVWREKDLPNTSGDAANEGHAAHWLLRDCVHNGTAPASRLGQRIGVDEDGDAFWNDGPVAAHYTIHVDHDMVSAIQKTLDVIEAMKAEQCYPERSYSIEHITGEKDAEGTVDVTQIRGRLLRITDLKYGMGVQVFAEENEQLLIYADAALEELDILEEIEHIDLCIAQPRLDHFDAWSITRAELKERIEKIRKTAKHVMTIGKIAKGKPGDKQCKFCRAKATCAEYRDHTLGAVMFTPVDDLPEPIDLKKGEMAVSIIEAERILANAYGVKPAAVTHIHQNRDEFFVIKKPTIVPQVEAATERIATESDEQLATVMDAADMIEGFVKAVRAEVERRLLEGKFTDARYKLVEGKKGARKWIDEVDAEKVMKAMRLKIDQMYDMKVKSPTQIEKVIKEANPRKWAKLQDQITQGGGSPSVAPASDKRPALSMKVEFEAIPDEVEFVEAVVGLSVEDDLI